MVSASLTDDNKWISLSGNFDEIKELRAGFTKKVNSWFIIKNKNKDAVIDEAFMTNIGVLPVGLWVELVNLCKKYNIELFFQEDFESRIKDKRLTPQGFSDYVGDLFSKNKFMSLRDYQFDGVYNMLCYKKCCVEISTSGGKTLMAYVFFRYLKDIVGLKQILFITPKTNLTTQSADKFIEYDELNCMETDWTFGEVHAKAKKKDEYNENIVFGNYQSLCRKSQDFFDKFDAVIVDECHHSVSYSIRKILKKCVNATYKVGMTGTFPETDSYDGFVIQSNIGPLVYRLSSYELINEKSSATPVVVGVFKMRYLSSEELAALYTIRAVSKVDDVTIGNKILSQEKDVARENKKRLKYVCDMISKTNHNALVLFSDVQNEYGRNIYNRLKETTEKHVMYIDGTVSVTARAAMKDAMEKDESGNTVLVASIGCFSEGIDICNVWTIFLTESTKSDTILAQILGRGMRKYEGKDKTVLVDFVDDYSYGNGFYSENYLLKHGNERVSIYQKRGFPINFYDVTF